MFRGLGKVCELAELLATAGLAVVAGGGLPATSRLSVPTGTARLRARADRCSGGDGLYPPGFVPSECRQDGCGPRLKPAAAERQRHQKHGGHEHARWSLWPRQHPPLTTCHDSGVFREPETHDPAGRSRARGVWGSAGPAAPGAGPGMAAIMPGIRCWSGRFPRRGPSGGRCPRPGRPPARSAGRGRCGRCSRRWGSPPCRRRTLRCRG